MRLSSFFQLLRFKFAKIINRQLFVLISTPCFGNVGDHTILLAQHELLEEAGLQKKVFEFTSIEYKNIKKHIRLRPNDVVVIDGGGNFGDTWPDTMNNILGIVSTYKNNKIFVFPESWYFSNTTSGLSFLKRTQEVFSQNPNVTVYARDSWSFDEMNKYLKCATIKQSFDCVLYKKMNVSNSTHFDNKKLVGFCLRDDKEKNILAFNDKIIYESLENLGFFVKKINNDCYSKIQKNKRIKFFETIIQEYMSCDIIVTDRFHGFIFSLLCDKPCILFDNTTGKVKHSFRDIEPYICNCRFLTGKEGNDYLVDLIRKLFGKKSLTASFEQEVATRRKAIIEELKRMACK